MNPQDLLHLLSDRQARRLRVIENLLRGRKTVSTLYWGQRYGLLYLLSLDKQLARGDLDAVAQVLVTHKLATWTPAEQPQLRLTPLGVAQRNQAATVQPVTQAVWPQVALNLARQRLLLSVQVVSQYAHQTARYYPLTTDLATQQAVRQWFHQAKAPDLADQVLTALTGSLKRLPTVTALVTTAGFSGYQHPGLTDQQLAQQLHQTPWEIYLRHVDGVVQIAQDARQVDHPLHALLAPAWQTAVTRSAQATLTAVTTTTLTLDQVATQRQIKPSTVREHLLEAAIMLPVTALPYERLLPVKTRQALLAVLPAQLDDWEYTALPTELQQQIDFFTFRLFAILRDKEGERHGRTPHD
ncbi:helix-turn-helix domain-containing protein [Levilactobacillus zymae]|uniref:helix-turn-helix domain-containing protein n=1 Tax=Levilactobacillus zymae TaxID=267363 RepID=UPI0028B343C3|nr:helix-turn-helix domain-containing protein [Levilactobacillus zymae]MDT6980549.1 helix-turn-helix domain-containing protein [Levilactobacillus zymae]